jgi:uncharacterized membrane protein
LPRAQSSLSNASFWLKKILKGRWEFKMLKYLVLGYFVIGLFEAVCAEIVMFLDGKKTNLRTHILGILLKLILWPINYLG